MQNYSWSRAALHLGQQRWTRALYWPSRPAAQLWSRAGRPKKEWQPPEPGQLVDIGASPLISQWARWGVHPGKVLRVTRSLRLVLGLVVIALGASIAIDAFDVWEKEAKAAELREKLEKLLRKEAALRASAPAALAKGPTDR